MTVCVLHNQREWLAQTQTWLYNQVRHLPQSIESHIFCYTTENLDQFSLPNLNVFADTAFWRFLLGPLARRGRGSRLRYALFARWLATQASRAGGHILHSHFGDHAWRSIGPARQAGLRHVVTFYGYDVNFLPMQNPAWRARYHDLFRTVDRVLCEGPHMAQCIVELGCPPEKVQVQHLGVDLEQIVFRPRVWDGEGPLRVLIAAAFREKKGIPYAVEALGRLAQELPLEVTIIGDANRMARSQAEKQAILEAIAHHNLHDRVRLLGYQPYEVLLREADEHHIFLSPSVHAADGDTEGGAPVSIIEMSASGMMIVSSTHCDIPAVIRHGESGLLAPERDVDALVEHLRWFAQHPERWQKMAETGRRHIEAEFNARVQGERLGRIYESLV